MMYYVYMLRCKDNSLYSGITTDLKRRLSEHCQKNGKGAKYTRSKRVVGIACAWTTEQGRSKASRLEARLKKLRKAQKEILCSAPERLCEFYDESELFASVNTGLIVCDTEVQVHEFTDK